MKTILLLFLMAQFYFSFSAGFAPDENDNLLLQHLNGKVKSVAIGKTDFQRFNLKGQEIGSISRYLGYTITEKQEHDSKGYVISKSYIDSASKNTIIKETFKYDSSGNKIEMRYFQKDGSEKSRTTYVYDENKKLVEESLYRSDNLIQKYVYLYDENGNIYCKNNYGSDGITITTQNFYKYDPRGNKISEEIKTKDNKYNWKITQKYDNHNNEVEYTYYGSDTNSTTKWTYEYIYDTHGNWTTKIRYSNGLVNGKLERIIEYY